MWLQALEKIRCPRCAERLRLAGLDPEHELPAAADALAAAPAKWIESGALLCAACRSLFPIHRGVPILLVYPTPMAHAAVEGWPASFREQIARDGLELPRDAAPRGEAFVQASFSTEWNDYDYGQTLWTAPTEDRIRTFRGECGLGEGELSGQSFCEIGCGLGIMTNEAASGLGASAFGVDLSQAVFRAAEHFRENPRLHFVQASVFRLPLLRGSFDFLYSHGVLHHTYSTKDAIGHAVQLLREGGSFYVWLYGFDDVRISPLRRLAYAGEQLTRPIIARLPGPLATAALWPLVPFYQWASVEGQKSGTHGARYSAQQALHAARDRFTPLFAHRHEGDEVRSWLLGDFGFAQVERVQGGEVSESWRLAIDRNVALRAHGRSAGAQAAPA